MDALSRLESLVNNELFADVVFSVGSDGTKMFGHKAILTMASDVFRAQFTGSFKESRDHGLEDEIRVIDIEPPVFKQVLCYAYCDRVTISADNVLHLLYAAEKYLLTKLANKCTTFIEQHLSEENVLQVFAQNERYNLEDINRMCLNIICSNPIRMFEDENFLTLDAKSLKLIAEYKRMNCELTQLLVGIENWLKIHERDGERGNEILNAVRKREPIDHMCSYLYNFSSGFYKTKIEFKMTIDVDRPFYIYGIGIVLKSRTSIEHETVRLDVSINRVDLASPTITRSMVVPVGIVSRIEEIMFERQEIDRGNGLDIHVKIDNPDWPMYSMRDFTLDQPEVRWIISHSSVRRSHVTTNCLQYVLYSETLHPPKNIAGQQLSLAKIHTDSEYYSSSSNLED